MTFLWILLGIVYMTCWVFFGLTTSRNGHYWLFWIGFLIPILWIIGALIAPTECAAARAGWWSASAQATPGPTRRWRAQSTSSPRSRWAVASFSALAVVVAVPSALAAVHSARANPGASRTVAGASRTVAYWGSLTGGPIPTKTVDTKTSPANVRLPGRVAEVATSNSDYYALLANGRVYAWGFNNHGQLGDGATKNSFRRPVRVRFPAGVKIASLPINVMPYDTGQAVDTTGHVWGWGFNGGGELCLGNRRRHLLPVKLPFTKVTAVAGAFDHAVYKSAGRVWACGKGRLGELGDGKFGKSFVPVKVKGLGPSAHVVALVAAFGNAGALLADGKYMDWGTNGLGQLGIGSKAKRSGVPVAVSLPAKVAQVAQGGSAPGNGQTLVLLANGALYAWGANKQGQLGDGKRTPKFSPERITPPSGVTYRLLASTGSTSYGVTGAGGVYAWGAGSKGQLGNGTTAGSLTPVKVATHATGISGTAYDVLVALSRHHPPPVKSRGALTQLPGRSGCLVDRATARPGCQLVRALRGPGPLLGSHAIAVSSDGKNLYVASLRSHAIAVFGRNRATGKVTQARGRAGCVAARAVGRCGFAVGLAGPNSVVVSPDGKNVYAVSARSNSLATFRRNRSTGALTQLPGKAGCVAKTARPRCASARGLVGPDIVAVSPDGKNVYVGAFFGANKSRPGPGARGGVVAFSRDRSSGALTQLPGKSGCIVVAPVAGCASGLALRNPEGLAVSHDGNDVYVAAPLSDAADVFARDPATGALTQATNGTGCLSSTPQSGCGKARVTKGVDAVAISPDDRTVYMGGGISESIPIFTRALHTGQLTQSAGTAGCVQRVLVNGCALGRPLVDPEGLTVSPDGANVYAMMYMSSALDVFNRDPHTGALMQKPGTLGCFTSIALRRCTRVRGGVRGVSSSVVSPDGKYLYAVAALSNSLTAFKITR